MIRKSSLSFIVLLSVFFSCKTDINAQNDLEGTWVENYTYKVNNKGNIYRDYTGYIHLLDFKGSNVRMKNFLLKETEMNIDTVVKFTCNGNTIAFGSDAAMQIQITKDSIVLPMTNGDIGNVVYKKLPNNRRQVHWKPKGKQYKVGSKDNYEYFDFIDDSVAHLFTDDSPFINKIRWQIEQINNHTLLVLHYGNDIDIVTIDSLEGDKMYATDYFLKKRVKVYNKQKKTSKKPSSLYGTWKLMSIAGKPVSDNKQLKIVLGNDFEKLHIQEDSIEIITEASPFSDSWKFYENIQTIALEKTEKAIQVSKVTKDSLVLQMDISEFGFRTNEVILVRE